MAKSRKRGASSGGGASTAEQLFADSQTAWEEAEGRGSFFYPKDGDYPATLTGWEVQTKETRDGDPYLWMKAAFTISDEGEYEGKETGEVFNSLPTTVQGTDNYIGLGRLKDMVGALNEGDVPEELSDVAATMEALAEAETPCNIRVLSNTDKKSGRTYTHIFVVADA